eukprot:COSAG02_NODE_6175_length_3750_cov_22.678992_1_plen_72_part_00
MELQSVAPPMKLSAVKVARPAPLDLPGTSGSPRDEPPPTEQVITGEKASGPPLESGPQSGSLVGRSVAYAG